MAKWGEGDPRWQVEEREDGTNANNWHWTEKKATTWSTKKLTELLVDLSASTAAGEASLSAVDSITGDCCANQRKGKLIFFYELVIKMKWKGKTKDGTVCNGTLSIPNLSEEYCDDMDDIQVDVTLTSDDTPERRKVKDIVRKDIAVLIREQLTKWCGARFPTRVLQLPVLF
jgi:activator of HSP90 ATPase